MQELWKKGIQWDEDIPDEFQKEWDCLSISLAQLKAHSLPRRFPCQGMNLEMTKCELHVFCDASAKAYAACVYLRILCGSDISCNLLFAKSRVAPVKSLSIPKLELTAAVIGSRLINFVEQHLNLPIAAKTLWSDSLCTLSWIERSKVSIPFVERRAREIREVPKLQFRYVPSESNPADWGSRGTTFSVLEGLKIWWKSPLWLLGSEPDWPKRPDREPSNPKPDEQVDIVTVDDEIEPDTLFNLKRYSSIAKAVRVTAYVLRDIKIFRRQSCRQGLLSAEELQDSLHLLELRVQKQHFSSILNHSQKPYWRNIINQLGLFVDHDGYIRCKGRFQRAADLPDAYKYPILLPKESSFTNLIIHSCHTKVMHFGVKHTLAKLRERYWICQGRSVVKGALMRCQVCRIHRGGPFKVPDSTPLPAFRASIKRPLACIGLDYLGPLYVREGTEIKKVWIALFTCAVIRAIHLEVIHSLSGADFMLCLRRFCALYGKPELIVSDNAKQFKAADQLLKKEFLRLSEDPEIVNYLSGQGMLWKYIVERAPWMGGFYERLVATVKESLKKSLGKWTVTPIELHTICYEVAFVINSRPLIYAEDDPTDRVLTPLDLMFRSSDCFADASGEQIFRDKITTSDELLMHWRAGQNLLRQFWDCWKTQYLLSLRELSRTQSQRGVSHIQPRVGTVVLIKENLPRGQWKVGKILKLRESHDGQVRAVEVKLPSGTNLVCPLKLPYPIEDSAAILGDSVTQDASSTSQSTQPIPVAKLAPQSLTLSRPTRQAALTILPTIIEVVPGHPLSPVHTFVQRLNLNNVRITSNRQGFYYIKLLHHGQTAAVEQLLSDVPMLWNPERIQPWSKRFISEENVNFLCKSGEVMRAILIHQIQTPGNPFQKPLEDELKLADDPQDVIFRVYSSHQEMVFSSGFRYGEWKDDIPGFNVYAEILQELVEFITGNKAPDNSLLDELLKNFAMFKPHIPRLVLLVSDSQARIMDEIQAGGDVVPVGGSRYQHMVDVLTSGRFQLSDCKYIIVYCGINCSVKPGYEFSQRDTEWKRLKAVLVDEASHRDKPSVLFCCSFDHPTANKDNPRHVEFIERQLQGTRVICVNWQRFGNPFLLRKGLLNYSLFDVSGKNPNKWHREIHINGKGFRVLWKTCCSLLDGMKFSHYSENKKPECA